MSDSQYPASTISPLAEIQALEPIECGTEAAKHFLFDEGYLSLNHGSYGTIPREVRNVFRHFQDRTEARPDEFVRYEYRTHLLDESRAVLAKYLNCPLNSLVLVPNATTAFETVVRNLVFKEGDVVITFASIYGSFHAPLAYLSEREPFSVEQIDYRLPISDDALCQAFEERIAEVRKRGRNPRMALFDTINTLPAVCMPFERLTRLCKKHDLLSFIDGAHGVGLFPIDISKLDADFFTSNCHKWLYVPRPCAVLCVPERNQGLIRTSLPMGFSWVQKDQLGRETKDEKSTFVETFAYTGTLDDNPCLCIKAALEWRKKLKWGEKTGEEAVMGYIKDLAAKGGNLIADMLGTEVLENEEKTLGGAGFANVRLPFRPSDDFDARNARGKEMAAQIMQELIQKHQTAVFVHFYEGKLWARLSAQVYLTIGDFEHAGTVLKRVCENLMMGGGLSMVVSYTA